MTIEFVDPRPPVRVASEGLVPPPTVRPPTAGLNNSMTIGLLANGFPDSESFLSGLAASLTDLTQTTGSDLTLEWRTVTKARPPDQLTDEQLAELAACDAVIAAYGH